MLAAIVPAGTANVGADPERAELILLATMTCLRLRAPALAPPAPKSESRKTPGGRKPEGKPGTVMDAGMFSGPPR